MIYIIARMEEFRVIESVEEARKIQNYLSAKMDEYLVLTDSLQGQNLQDPQLDFYILKLLDLLSYANSYSQQKQTTQLVPLLDSNFGSVVFQQKILTAEYWGVILKSQNIFAMNSQFIQQSKRAFGVFDKTLWRNGIISPPSSIIKTNSMVGTSLFDIQAAYQNFGTQAGSLFSNLRMMVNLRLDHQFIFQTGKRYFDQLSLKSIEYQDIYKDLEPFYQQSNYFDSEKEIKKLYFKEENSANQKGRDLDRLLIVFKMTIKYLDFEDVQGVVYCSKPLYQNLHQSWVSIFLKTYNLISDDIRTQVWTSLSLNHQKIQNDKTEFMVVDDNSGDEQEEIKVLSEEQLLNIINKDLSRANSFLNDQEIVAIREILLQTALNHKKVSYYQGLHYIASYVYFKFRDINNSIQFMDYLVYRFLEYNFSTDMTGLLKLCYSLDTSINLTDYDLSHLLVESQCPSRTFTVESYLTLFTSLIVNKETYAVLLDTIWDLLIAEDIEVITAVLVNLLVVQKSDLQKISPDQLLIQLMQFNKDPMCFKTDDKTKFLNIMNKRMMLGILNRVEGKQIREKRYEILEDQFNN